MWIRACTGICENCYTSFAVLDLCWKPQCLQKMHRRPNANSLAQASAGPPRPRIPCHPNQLLGTRLPPGAPLETPKKLAGTSMHSKCNNFRRFAQVSHKPKCLVFLANRGLCVRSGSDGLQALHPLSVLQKQKGSGCANVGKGMHGNMRELLHKLCRLGPALGKPQCLRKMARRKIKDAATQTAWLKLLQGLRGLGSHAIQTSFLGLGFLQGCLWKLPRS